VVGVFHTLIEGGNGEAAHPVLNVAGQFQLCPARSPDGNRIVTDLVGVGTTTDRALAQGWSIFLERYLAPPKIIAMTTIQIAKELQQAGSDVRARGKER
jgi:hypothetical protein